MDYQEYRKKKNKLSHKERQTYLFLRGIADKRGAQHVREKVAKNPGYSNKLKDLVKKRI